MSRVFTTPNGELRQVVNGRSVLLGMAAPSQPARLHPADLAALRPKQAFPHLVFGALTLMTGGILLPLWLFAYICRNRRKYA